MTPLPEAWLRRARSTLCGLTLCGLISLFISVSLGQSAERVSVSVQTEDAPGTAEDAAEEAVADEVDATERLLNVPDDALPLAAALAAAERRTDVVNARLNAADAESALTRAKADPLGLRLERTQAEQRLALSAAQLRQARYQALADIAAGYTGLLEAQAQFALAEAGRDVSAQTVDITRIRLNNGSATALDVQDAENDLQTAETNLSTAEQGLALARTSLESLIGQEVSAAAPLGDELLTDLPGLDEVLGTLETHPSLLQATQGAEIAAISADILDPSYASRAQIDAAALQREQAEEAAKEAGRGLRLRARSLYNAADSAARSYRATLDTLASAQEREALQAQRLEAGLIADISFRQTQLGTYQAALSTLSAKNAYLNALLELQAGTVSPLEGLHEF